MTLFHCVTNLPLAILNAGIFSLLCEPENMHGYLLFMLLVSGFDKHLVVAYMMNVTNLS